MKIFKDLDLENPKIVKENNKITWVNETGTGEKDENSVQNLWYETYFSLDTQKFAENKANNDIRSMSAPEYVLAQLKYLEEEYERENDYINRKFHNKINQKNYDYLIGKVSAELAKMDTGVKNMHKRRKYYSCLLKKYKKI